MGVGSKIEDLVMVAKALHKGEDKQLPQNEETEEEVTLEEKLEDTDITDYTNAYNYADFVLHLIYFIANFRNEIIKMSDKPVLKSIVGKFETYYEENGDSNDSFTFTYEPVNIDSLICSYVKESELPNGTKKQDDTSEQQPEDRILRLPKRNINCY